MALDDEPYDDAHETDTTPAGIIGRTPRLGILMVASEAAPWAKTGGLADVVGALPGALARLGHEITTILPRYKGVELSNADVTTRTVRFGGISRDVTFHVVHPAPNCRAVFVDVPALFDRDGFYGYQGQDFDDNAERFAVLAASALEFANADTAGRPIDVVHAHDWQAGLVPAFIRTDPVRYARFGGAGTVFTVHNLAYQGVFAREVVPEFGLPWDAFTLNTGEFWGQFSYLKAGITYSDYITTVSPSYARETQRPEFGCGMEGVLEARARRYVGILNGIDTDVWNPARDPLLPARFEIDSLDGKRICKQRLLERFGFSCGDDALARPLVGLVSRLVDQKGIDLIQQASEQLAALDATWVFVGLGESRFEEFLKAFAARFPARVGVHIGFDEGLAHLVEAGSDVFLMPSKFEPCGLNQMYSLRYGTVPIVHAVGGLDDTVQPYTARARHANGFKFREPTPDALLKAVRQALRLFHDKAVWLPLMREGMAADHSWETSAREYVRVYRRARHTAAERVAR